MADALAKPMNLESFRAWEERQELRYEFDGFRPIALTGGTYAHARIQASVLRTLAIASMAHLARRSEAK